MLKKINNLRGTSVVKGEAMRVNLRLGENVIFSDE
jgi:hypothetical protein